MAMDEENGALLALHGHAPDCPQTRRLRWLLALAVAAVVAVALAVASATHRVGDRFQPVSTNTSADATAIARHFATKTAYWNQRRHATQPGAAIPRRDAPLRGLRLIQTQFVTRHGIRYPTLSPIRDIETLLVKLAPFGATLPQWLRGYKLQYNQSVAGELAEPGGREMETFARRELATHGRGTRRAVFSTDTFQLSHTHVQRTKDSAKAFARRYFSNPHDVTFIERPKHNDTLLRFFDVCDRYQRHVKQNASALAQRHAFANSRAMATALRELHESLHLDVRMLTGKDLSAAFSACAFDVALYGIHDQWCSLFRSKTVATLDYDDDLKAFYQLAGGYAINYEMASVLLQDIVVVMDQRISGATIVEGAFRFAHAETTLPLVTLLGFGNKTPLLANATRKQIQARRFRTSALAPFAANIEFRLYAQKDTPSSYYVQVIVNERDDVVLPGCGVVFCPLATLKTSLWRRFLYDYDFAEQCRA